MPEAGPRIRPFATPAILPAACPIHASLGVLGRKWALLVLRDIAFYEEPRFSDILRMNPGLTPRVLSFRLNELMDEAYIQRTLRGNDRREKVYALTPKGQDAIPILAAFVSFGIRHHAGQVFGDGKPRTMAQLLPGSQCEMLGRLRDYALAGARRPSSR